MDRQTSVVAFVLLLLLDAASSFVPHHSTKLLVSRKQTSVSSNKPSRFLGTSSDDDRLDSKFGGYTAKQRLREEVEYPFRTFRLYIFGYSTVSAAVALYFSLLNVAGRAGGDSAALGDALQSCAINVGALVVCGYLTYREWQAGNTNLERISRGGALAKLRVVTASGGERRDLASYRRRARLCLAVGSQSYIETLCRTLCADQRADSNTFVDGLQEAEVMVVPILLEATDRDDSSKLVVRDSAPVWQATESAPEDRNFDVRRADPIVAFPSLYQQYTEYLQQEIEACKAQGFDVYEKGFVLVVKKNGKILRRVTGQPPLQELIETLQMTDINFGMPGDTEKYGN